MVLTLPSLVGLLRPPGKGTGRLRLHPVGPSPTGAVLQGLIHLPQYSIDHRQWPQITTANKAGRLAADALARPFTGPARPTTGFSSEPAMLNQRIRHACCTTLARSLLRPGGVGGKSAPSGCIATARAHTRRNGAAVAFCTTQPVLPPRGSSLYPASTMPTPRPILDPLRSALAERSAVDSLRKISDACGVEYKRLLAFSQGGPPAFEALDVDRLAAYLGMRLVYDVPEQAPQKPAARKR